MPLLFNNSTSSRKQYTGRDIFQRWFSLLCQWCFLVVMLVFLRLISSVDGIPVLSSLREEWRHITYWWRYERIGWFYHQLHMLVRDRTVFSHTVQGCRDLTQCPADHWQPDPAWTLVEYFDKWVLFAVVKYKPTRRFFSFIDLVNAKDDQWMKDEIDEGCILAIHKGSTLVPIVCVLTKEQEDDYRTQRGLGFRGASQAREDCWEFDDEASMDYELREIAEDDWHDHERDGRYAEWEEEFGSLYAQHALWKWDVHSNKQW